MTTTYSYTAESFLRGLTSLNVFLDKAEAFAKAKKFEPDTLLTARLSPDMYPLVKQIQVACDTAKGTVARLTQKQPPKHEDNEKTFSEIRARVAKTIDYVKTFSTADFKNCEDRKIDLPWAEGKWMHAGQYIPEMALPNFYFHLAMAYGILRHNGVDLGKMDFIGKVNING
jgi:hypothetical protein